MNPAPTEAPKAILYCCRDADGNYYHFYPSARVVQLGGCSKGKIVRVRLVPDSEHGNYWCWHDFEDNEYRHVYPSLILLKMCFTYGIEVEEERDRGIRVRVRVEELSEEQT